jgi:hypothetical protein
MSTHRIVCVYWLKAKSPSLHHHVIGVGTGTGRGHSSRPSQTWTVDRAIEAIDAGPTFVAADGRGERAVKLAAQPCPLCGLDVLVPDPPEAFDDVPECLMG